MKIGSLSVVVGTDICNANCPFCVSKMTGIEDIKGFKPVLNKRNLRIACELAKLSGVTSILLTGRGEPTLYPKHITDILKTMKRYRFPLVDLQTNGIVFDQKWDKYEDHLHNWYTLGLSTVALSITHYDKEKNRKIYLPNSDSYIDLPLLIERLHTIGYSVRLSCVMLRDHIDTPDEVANMIAYAQSLRVEQLTVRPVARVDKSESINVAQATQGLLLLEDQKEAIATYLRTYGTPLMTLGHGAEVFDFGGQNICLTNCLTIEPDTENLRQIIFTHDGHIKYDWRYHGAILL